MWKRLALNQIHKVREKEKTLWIVSDHSLSDSFFFHVVFSIVLEMGGYSKDNQYFGINSRLSLAFQSIT